MRLRRSIAIGAVVAALLPMATPAVGAPRQQVKGTLLVPGLWEGCEGFVGSVLYTSARLAPWAYRFAVPATTWGRPFTLAPGRPIDQLRIRFVRVAGGTTILPSDKGSRVPRSATEAWVCLYLGGPLAPFTYTVA